MDIVERLRVFAEFKNRNEKLDSLNIMHEAADKIELLRKERDGLRKVNVMQSRWLDEAHKNHKLFKDKVRQLLSVESAALKEGE